jgi:hypothetical protein
MEASRSPLSSRPKRSEVRLPESEASRLITSKSGYRQFYGLMKDIPLPVSRETGSLLYMLTRSIRAQSILEFGTSYGVSTIYLAAGLRDNGGGRIITTEFESSKVARARQHLTEAKLMDLVEIREGDALQTLAHDLPETLDLLLVDGAKGLYTDILECVAAPASRVTCDHRRHSPLPGLCSKHPGRTPQIPLSAFDG